MSRNNRKMIYDKLVAADELWKDDGALEAEFGKPTPPPEPEKKKVKKSGS
jgi:hypothetical protein